MGRKCFVPNCTSGYKSDERSVSLFKAPKDEKMIEKWRKSIPRTDRVLTEKDSVCEKHFLKDAVIKKWTVAIEGSIVHDVDVRPRLAPDAIPVIFPSCLAHLSRSKTAKKKSAKSNPIMPQQETIIDNEMCESSDLLSPEVLNFGQLKDSAKNLTLPSNSWGFHIKDDQYISFCDIEIVSPAKVFVRKVVTYNETLNWRVCVNGGFPVDVVEVLNMSPEVPRSVNDVIHVLNSVHNITICHGVPNTKDLCDVYTVCGYIDFAGAWRHEKCQQVFEGKTSLCLMCQELQRHLGVLKKMKVSKRLRVQLEKRDKDLQHAKQQKVRKLKACRQENQSLKNQMFGDTI